MGERERKLHLVHIEERERERSMSGTTFSNTNKYKTIKRLKFEFQVKTRVFKSPFICKRIALTWKKIHVKIKF